MPGSGKRTADAAARRSRSRERRRERYFSAREFARLEAALADAECSGAESPAAILAIRLLLLTGCRRREILGLRWEDIDFEHACLRLPDAKIGAKTVHLIPAAVHLLRDAEEENVGPWVLPGSRGARPLVSLDKPWRRIRQAAGLAGRQLRDGMLGKKQRFRTADVIITPVGKRIRYEVLSPLFCVDMNGPVRNRDTYTSRDMVWLWVFGSRARVERFRREGKALERRMRLNTLGYDPCDFAENRPASRGRGRSREGSAPRAGQ